MKLDPTALRILPSTRGLTLVRYGSAVEVSTGAEARSVLNALAEVEAGALPFVPPEPTPPASVAEAVRERCAKEAESAAEHQHDTCDDDGPICKALRAQQEAIEQAIRALDLSDLAPGEDSTLADIKAVRTRLVHENLDRVAEAASLRAQVARLEEAIRNAPHGDRCCFQVASCDCWKAALLPAPKPDAEVAPAEKPATEPEWAPHTSPQWQSIQALRAELGKLVKERAALRAQLAEATKERDEANAHIDRMRTSREAHKRHEAEALSAALVERDAIAQDRNRLRNALEALVALGVSDGLPGVAAFARAALAPSPAEAVKAEPTSVPCSVCGGPLREGHTFVLGPAKCDRCAAWTTVSAMTISVSPCPRCSVSGAPCACREVAT